MKITSLDKTVSKLLGSDYFRIPRFQRPYSWDRGNIEDFWNDTIVENDGDYFIGSIVLFKDGTDTFGIVDGQQRLTTIIMMLCVLRNALKDAGLTDLAAGIHKLVERPDINNKNRYVLESETAYPYLHEFIMKFGTPETDPPQGDEEDALKETFAELTSRVKAVIDSKKEDASASPSKIVSTIEQALISIRDKVLNLNVISVELDNEDDAYIIFETLNTRGKDLRVSHLVKNHLAKLLKQSNKGVDTVRDKWNRILELLENSQADIGIDSFLHHYWLSRYEYIPEKKLFKSIKKSIKKENALEFLQTLEKESQLYRSIQESSYGKWKPDEQDIRLALEAFDIFHLRQPIPFLLSLFRSYREGLARKKTLAILSAIESFHFMYTAIASKTSSGGMSKMYAVYAQRLAMTKAASAYDTLLKELRGKLSDRLPTYAEFEAGFLALRFSDVFTRQRRLVKYVLRRLDRHHGAGVVPDYNQMTVEHVAAQNPATNVAISLDHVAMIGNLILVDKPLNDKLANKSFADKQKILAKSNVAMKESISKATSWDEATIEARTKELAQLAYKKIWAF